MTAPKRSNRSAKAAGSRLERRVADYLMQHVDDRIDRKVQTGAKDQGDIGGVRTMMHPRLGQRVVVECKDTAKLNIGPHLREAEVERINDGALVGLVVQKRHGVGDIGQQLVCMTLADLVALLTGSRPST